MVNSFQKINTNPRSMMAGTSVILNIYLLTIGSMILGFSLYVGLETLERTTRKYVNWTGEGMLWLFVLLFISIFILFIPSDLLKLKYQIKIETFTNLIGYVVFTISNSIFFIILSRFISRDNIYLSEVANLLQAASFSGLIAIPILFYLLFQFKDYLLRFNSYLFYFVMFFWIFASQIFL